MHFFIFPFQTVAKSKKNMSKYTLTLTVANVVTDVLNYHVEIGNASFTVPTV